MATEKKTAWQPMNTAPHRGLIIIKCHVEGGYWPVIASYNHTHGGFTIPPVLGQTETLVLAPEAWTEIPSFDTGVHAREVAAA